MLCFQLIFRVIVRFNNIHLLSNMANTAQTSVILTICKIFNWADTQSSTHFEIFIYSLKTSSLLLSKSIKATFSHHQAIFNYSLKVHYPTDENQILIKLANLSKHTNTMHNIAEFTLNLDNLLIKKMQFFPFGKNDKVLKIAVGEQEKPQKIYNTRFNQQNYNFIQQKEQFLKKISNNSSSSRLNDHSLSKKTFSEKARNLLAEVKYKKQQKNIQRNDIEQQYNNYYHNDDESDYMKVHLHQAKRMNKSNSERTFLSPKMGKLDIYKNRREEEEYEKKSNKSQKHKLALKSLEMVACQNQYYQESEYHIHRPVSVIPQNKFPQMKTLVKPQLY